MENDDQIEEEHVRLTPICGDDKQPSGDIKPSQSGVNEKLDTDDINPAKMIAKFFFGKHHSQENLPNDSELYLNDNLFEVMLTEENYEADELESSGIEFLPTQCSNGEYIQVVTPLELTEEEDIIHATEYGHKSKKRSRKQDAPVKTRIARSNNSNENEVGNITDVSNNGGESISDENEEDLEPNNMEKLDIIDSDISGNKKTKKKMFTCLDCDKTFSYKCNLQLHAATHSNEKHYSCPICNKKFKLKAHLDTHRKVHDEYYEFKCEICGKEFKLKGNMKTHIKTKHLDERTHTCYQCGRTFKMKQHLLTHMRIKHS